MSTGGTEFTVAVRVSVLRDAMGALSRAEAAELTVAPLPARWRDIMNDIDLEEMLVDRRRSDSEHGSPRDLEIEITRALDRLKAS